MLKIATLFHRGLLLMPLLLIAWRGNAQVPFCSSRTAPSDSLAAIEARLADYLRLAPKTAAGTVYVRVAVHVVYQNAGQDISDAGIRYLLQEVNKGFRKNRLPPFAVRPVFDSLWADFGIELCLADRDPGGQPSTGITHRQTSAVFSSAALEDLKHSSSGGEDAWPVGQYLNIWVAPLNGSNGATLGNAVNNNVYAVTGKTEGVVINMAYPDLLVNVFTHEVGHFLGGLHHTFDNAAELVDDTPYEGSNSPNSVAGSCSAADLSSNTSAVEAAYWGTINPPDMVENFMGYDRPCQFMFTKGQKQRALAMLNQYYGGLLKNECSPLSVPRLAAAPLPLRARACREAGRSLLRFSGSTGTCSYRILDPTGRVVLQGLGQEGGELWLDELPAGLYLLQQEGAGVQKFVR